MKNTIQTGFRKLHIYQTRSFKFDFISAIVVFLVAIPLCLGIALASGAPLFSGILSGIIGGIVVGCISSSQVSVSGPAAGMATVVLTAITQLGSFESFLLALTIAGGLQILIGTFRAGFIADYIPSNVIQGLLCAIGILLIIKQLPLAFSLSSSMAELKDHLLDVSNPLSFEPLRNLSMHLNTGALIISLLSFAILLYWDKTKISSLRTIPGAIVAVVVGVMINEFFSLYVSVLAQNEPHLVNIPRHEGFIEFFSEMQSPNWSAFKNPHVYFFAILIAVIASLESLLNVKAAEKLDKNRPYCSKDQELLAQGVGNLVAGLVGGVPITSVIVRTSINIQSGAKTKFSTILHGVFILLAVMLIPGALNKIPLSALATILIHTGYKLTKPSLYRTIYHQGPDRFIPFIVTTVSILIFNLLEGIIIGLIVSLFYILKSSSQARIDIIQEIYPKGIINRLILPQQTTFLNKASLMAELDSIPENSQLVIDAHYSEFIDKEVMEYLKEFQKEQAPQKQISLNLVGFKDNYNIHNVVDFINVTTYDVQSTLTPNDVLNILKEGNERFLKDTMIHRHLLSDIHHTAETQHPIAVVLGCIDSRVPIETIFDMSFGDILCIRIAGNVVNHDILASIEFACNVAKAKLIVVLGHTNCGAIKAACDHVKQGYLTQLLEKVNPAISAETETSTNRTSSNIDFVNNVTDLNVVNALWHVYHDSSIIQELTNNANVGLVGAVYDIFTGKVDFKDYSTDVFKLKKEDDAKVLSAHLRELRPISP